MPQDLAGILHLPVISALLRGVIWIQVSVVGALPCAGAALGQFWAGGADTDMDMGSSAELGPSLAVAIGESRTDPASAEPEPVRYTGGVFETYKSVKVFCVPQLG